MSTAARKSADRKTFRPRCASRSRSSSSFTERNVRLPFVISDLPDLASRECDCHEWREVDEIGGWPHSLAGGRASQPKSVRDIVATEPIWDRSELPREELTARVIAAGYRIDHAYALSAMTFADGRVSLDNGVHRWAVAVELGIKRLPVEMLYESQEPRWAWTWW
jgi:hypothetical protein